MKMQKLLTSLVVAVLILISPIFATMPTYAQSPQPPEDPNESWNPPEDGGEPFMLPKVESKPSASYYPPPHPGILPSIQNTYLINESGQRRAQFGDEPFYLVVQINTPGHFYLAEYYPFESRLTPHWLIYRYHLDRAGSWTFGPFYPMTDEPPGQHTWKLWLYASGAWAQKVTNFTYQPSYTYPPYPYPYPTPTPITTPTPGGWGSIQVIVVTALVGALGVTIGMLISGRQRYATKPK